MQPEELPSWAEQQAAALLSGLGDRWRHVQAVAAQARQVSAAVAPDDRPYLVAAAWLHDVGYAPALNRLGFHPVDGAAAGGQLHHRGQPGHPLVVSARRGLAGALVCLEPGRLRHRRVGPLNVAHAPDRLSAQLFAALPPVALLGALELLMSVARTGLPPTNRSAAEDRSTERDPTATAVARPQLPAPDHPAAGNGSGPPRDSRTRVRELVARERATGIRLHARDVAAAAGISERRAYELLRAFRAEEPTP